jgi:hypothetical protein
VITIYDAEITGFTCISRTAAGTAAEMWAAACAAEADDVDAQASHRSPAAG